MRNLLLILKVWVLTGINTSTKDQ